MNFFLTLPSNSSLGTFPSNTISNFRTKLSRQVHLPHPGFEIALTEISYIYDISQFYNSNQTTFIEFTDVNSKETTIVYLQKDQFIDINDLISHISETVNASENFERSDFIIQYNHNERRVRVSVNELKYKIRFSEKLNDVLGFDKTQLFAANRKLFVAKYPPDLKAGLYYMYLYTNIIEPQLVGDTQSRLLRAVELNGKPGKLTTLSFNKPYYINLSVFDFDVIHLFALTECGDQIGFNTGIMTVTLHIKEKK